MKELEAKHESAGAALYAGLCRAAIERILAGPEKWVDQPHDIMLRLESYIRRAEALEAAEAENESLRAEALRHAGECARHAADDRAVIADLRAERDRLRANLINLAAARKATDIATCPCDPDDGPCDHYSFDAPLMDALAALVSGEENR